MHIRVLLSKYRAYVPCPACKGTRFNNEAMLYRLGGITIAEFYAMSINDAAAFITSVAESLQHDKSVAVLVREISSRLSYLVRIGLGYLTLDRQSRTLSGGEVERASLTTALGSSLVNTLYVLDEPSIGLHPRDTRMLIDTIRNLCNIGNTILIVEHDADIIRQSDHVIDMGPRSGDDGGTIVFSGTPEALSHSTASLTGRYLSGRSTIPVPAKRRNPDNHAWITVKSACVHNLQNITTRIPLGILVCITGVSGSGKSTLLEEVLFKELTAPRGKQGCCFFEGSTPPASVVLMDQSPIGKTPRSNPITYIKAFDAIRCLFADTDLARQRGYTPATFSFNSSGGRCEQCRGEGAEKVEMQFLADVYVQCPACNGTRYTQEVLEVQWRGKNIRDVLQMTVGAALEFFKGHPEIEQPLQILDMVGLGYLRLGQPATTLSGGEAQRLKIASFIRRGIKTRTLFLFDEPTTGLHPDDIARLLKTFDVLLGSGHSIIVVEHNMDVAKCSDYIIDLGPEGGSAGGNIVACGTPEEVIESRTSHTARFLREALHTAPPSYLTAPEPEQQEADNGHIVIIGAREHNLKNITVRMPRDRLIVITGVSGSGKSTLAFDILFAEGQRRFLETLSPYARQYIQQLQRPEVDSLRGLPPSIAIEQFLSRGGKKSTVATITEIYHYLRLLYAKVGTQHCPSCSRPLVSRSPADIVDDILTTCFGKRFILLSPQIRSRKGLHKEVITRARKSGFEKIRIDGTIIDVNSIFAIKRYHEHRIEIVVAELNAIGKERSRIQEAVNRGLTLGSGEIIVLCGEHETFYSIRAYCPVCSRSMPEPDPRLFSFNSSLGACPHCDGLGVVRINDRNSRSFPNLRIQRSKGQNAEEWNSETDTVCPICDGTRLIPAARSVLLNGKSIVDLVRMTPGKLLQFITSYARTASRPEIVTPIVQELIPKLALLERAGLSYLTLDRSADTLSGGEAQRIRLAAQVASPLRGVAYVLDEPTIGLHPHDTDNLLDIIRELRDRGNTVVVVEHDEKIIRHADYIIDLGPSGGTHGGTVVAAGSVEDIMRTPDSATGAALASQNRPLPHDSRPLHGCSFLSVFGAAQHNLKNINAHFPIGRLTVVTGVSGSGKTTLVRETLYKAVQQYLGRPCGKPGAHTSINGAEAFKRAVEIDQSPIGSTPRSIPATYVGVYDAIRKLFAGLPDARMRGFTHGHFSFNVSGGRCEACRGQGKIKVVMNFLPNLFVDCEECRGTRFNNETLQILFRGKNIADVLAMTIEEAGEFFSSVPSIRKPLELMSRMGIGYLQLGQPSPTLSGGEAQRIKIAAELCQNDHGKTLYVLDEPTTGL
ncbi:MAG: ATP-binding cassette domain-containing protein, partial [Desulfobacterota bacterium]|nr:ATP-binding cassette domain-containing protein [Thermodesulfobacteriota bacterium]